MIPSGDAAEDIEVGLFDADVSNTDFISVVILSFLVPKISNLIKYFLELASTNSCVILLTYNLCVSGTLVLYLNLFVA